LRRFRGLITQPPSRPALEDESAQSKAADTAYCVCTMYVSLAAQLGDRDDAEDAMLK
jgi:hypothetical protein